MKDLLIIREAPSGDMDCPDYVVLCRDCWETAYPYPTFILEHNPRIVGNVLECSTCGATADLHQLREEWKMKELIVYKNTSDETRELELTPQDLEAICWGLALKQLPGVKVHHITWSILIDSHNNTPYIHFRAIDHAGRSHDLVFDHKEIEGVTNGAKDVINFDLTFEFILENAPIEPKEEILQTNPPLEDGDDGD